MLPSTSETRATVKPSATLPLLSALLLPILLLLANAPLAAADHATVVREAIIYLSPDASSHKLVEAERGREIILLDKSHNWLQVEALLGYANVPDPNFIEDEDADRKTVTGWILDVGIVWPSTPNGDRILFGSAVDSEEEGSRRHGRRGAAQDALRLYHRVYDLFPSSPLAGEALYRAADINGSE